MWYVLAPILIVSVIAIVVIIARRFEEKKIRRLEAKFGHPVLGDFSITSGDHSVVASYMPWQGRSSISNLTLKVPSIEAVAFSCKPEKNFSYYEKCFDQFIQDESVRSALSEIFSVGFTSVDLREGELTANWMHYKPENKEFDQFAETVAKNLVQINKKIPEFFIAENLTFDTVTDKKQKALTALSYIPPLFLLLFAGFIFFSNYILDRWELLGICVFLGMPPTPFFRNRVLEYSENRPVLARNTTKYTVAFFISMIALFFILGCGLNIFLPQKSAETLQLRIVRFERHSTKHGYHYNAVVKDWIHQDAEIELSLPGHKLTTDFVKVTISKGALGLYWVSDTEYVR